MLIVMFALCLGMLSGCNGVAYDFSKAFSRYKSMKTPPQIGDVLCELTDYDGSAPLENYGNAAAIETAQGQRLVYSAALPESGSYNLSLRYFLLGSGLINSEISVCINGSEVLSRAPLFARWTSDGAVYKDKIGNEISPEQKKLSIWQEDRLYSYSCSTALPFEFQLEEGTNTIEIQLVAGHSVLIGELTVKSAQELPSYEDYSASHPQIYSDVPTIEIEAEKPAYKNDSKTVPAASSDVNVTPYDTYVNVLNYLDGFEDAAQTVYYKFNVLQTGLYSIAFNYNVSVANRTVFVTLFLDGKVPFGEALHYPLTSTNDYTLQTLGQNKAFSFWLSEGEHTLAIKMDSELVYAQTEILNKCIGTLNSVYLDLRKIAGSASDVNREWNPDVDYPGVAESLEEIGNDVAAVKKELIEVNGAEVNYQGIIYLESVEKAIKGLLKKPQKIASNYAQLAEGSGSIVQSLSNAVLDIRSTPMELDKILCFPSNAKPNYKRHGGFYSFWEGVKQFFHSYTADYSSSAGDKETLTVWVARSRQYVDLMQQLFDSSSFYKDTGFKVEFQLLTDEGKLILSNAAGLSPDVVMGISNWLPYEMGIRELTYDLMRFDDYPEVMGRFSEGAFIPLIADERALGLPETQDFYVMYYRKDIMQRYNLTLPQTWDDVVSMLPALQRAGLNFYIPLSSSVSSKSIMTTAPFIYQFGGTLFSEDGSKTTIDDENSINAIKMMTELYTLYSLPQQVSNFFDSFRNGSLPIGISTFETFVRLSFAAPEVAGLWDIALAPGVYNEESKQIERWQTGSSTSVVLMDTGKQDRINAGWELLKWWTSESVQTQFMNKLTTMYGSAYIWNSANLNAFKQSASFTDAQKQTILSQWQWMREIPRVPGWYMLERELSNAWNSIVINTENTRAVVEAAVTRVNKELERKLTEFGYMKNGIMIKPYTVTTIDYVKNVKNGVRQRNKKT